MSCSLLSGLFRGRAFACDQGDSLDGAASRGQNQWGRKMVQVEQVFRPAPHTCPWKPFDYCTKPCTENARSCKKNGADYSKSTQLCSQRTNETVTALIKTLASLTSAWHLESLWVHPSPCAWGLPHPPSHQRGPRSQSLPSDRDHSLPAEIYDPGSSSPSISVLSSLNSGGEQKLHSFFIWSCSFPDSLTEQEEVWLCRATKLLATFDPKRRPFCRSFTFVERPSRSPLLERKFALIALQH